jgi:glycine betaine/proline transport system substrate-binding protein
MESKGVYFTLYWKKKLASFLLIIPFLVLVACSGAQDEKELVFADAGWDSIRFHNQVASFILQKGYGYKTSETPGSTSATLLGLKRGSIDVYMEMWLQNIKKTHDEMVKSGKIQDVGVNFNDNRQGFYVPTYLIKGDPKRNIKPVAPDLKTVDDLKKYPQLFKDPSDPQKGRIFSAPTGWEVSNILQTKVKTYGLDKQYTLFSPGSDTALTASLTKAYEKGEPWVGYYWEPTWVMGKYDMTLLEEPKYDEKVWNKNFGTAFPVMEVKISVNKDTAKEHPEVVEFLKKYRTSNSLTNEALAYMQQNKVDAKAAAQWWLKKHPEVWTKWVPSDIAAKVKKAL